MELANVLEWIASLEIVGYVLLAAIVAPVILTGLIRLFMAGSNH